MPRRSDPVWNLDLDPAWDLNLDPVWDLDHNTAIGGSGGRIL
jgi:hypothetical protein